MGSVNGDEQTVCDLQSQWMAAWLRRDRAALEQILAPDFALIVSARPTQPMPRQQWLEAALGSYRGTSFDYETMSIRILGDVAIVASVALQQAAIDGADRSGRFFLTDVWRRSAKSWQVVARHSSHPEPPSASAQKLTPTDMRPVA
jgi:ketosteroid isomerase-like protein